MKATIFLLVLCLLTAGALFSQTTNNLQTPTSVNTDGTPPDASAMLDVQSTTQGLLAPRMTTAQRTAIASPATGLLVYDTDTRSFWYHETITWNEIALTSALSESGTNPTGIPIPDNDPEGITSIITLGGTDTVATDTRFRVCLDIEHSWTDNLDISLEAPDGTVIDLSSDNGSSGSNYTGTCFTTEASNPITIGNAPFTGNWQPEEPFANFVGKAIVGDWKLIVVDDDGLTIPGTGQLNHWSLAITRAVSVPSMLADADGDTRMTVEELSDEDIIRFEARGNRRLEIRHDSSVFTGRLRVDGIFLSGTPSNTATGQHSSVIGGTRNSASGFEASVVGGDDNTASSFRSAVVGGFVNLASDSGASVVGGYQNTASGRSSFVGGGNNNIASGFYSFIGGGSNSYTLGNSAVYGGSPVPNASGINSFIGGGGYNQATGHQSFVGGGIQNTTSGNSSFIGGGRGLSAVSMAEAVFGTWNTDYVPIEINGINAADRLFVIGNGTSTSNRSDAFTVWKNGEAAIGNRSSFSWIPNNAVLTVYGGHAFLQNNFGVLSENQAGNGFGAGFDTGTSDELYLYAGGANRMTISTTGKVGIGTDAPAFRLDLQGDNTDDGPVIQMSNSDRTKFVRIFSGRENDPKPYINWQSGTNFQFFTSNNDFSDLDLHMLIDSTGKVGISNSTPSADLHIKQSEETEAGSGGLRLERTASTNNWKAFINSNDDMYFAYNGQLKAWIDHTDGSYGMVSDRRLKKNITPVSPVLASLVQLKPMRYHFNEVPDDSPKSFGFIAQEVHALFPDVVEVKNGLYTMNYTELGVLSIKAIQEQQTIIEKQQSEIESLQSQLSEMDELKIRMARLEAALLKPSNLSPQNSADK